MQRRGAIGSRRIKINSAINDYLGDFKPFFSNGFMKC